MKVLIITGAPGVGKSTISKLWAKKNKGVTIECDYFTEWIFNNKYKRFGKLEEKLVIELTLKTSEIYLIHKMPVVIENVWKSDAIKLLNSGFQKINKNFDNKLDISFVYLYCAIKENHRRDKMRIPENQMKKRVDIVNNELKKEIFPSYVKKIDSTNLSENETLNIINNFTS
ncbi:MAG: AAA family ATPase [Ignavibacteria bacterium]|nr:AAA family ATPase [Ignavibacteria bacterium]